MTDQGFVLDRTWTRPKVWITTTFRQVSYAPESMEVQIDDDDVSAADIVAILTAMAYVAYGPVPPSVTSSMNGQMSPVS